MNPYILTIIILLVLILILLIKNNYLFDNTVNIKSTVDSKIYTVQNIENKETASDVLAIMSKKIKIISIYLRENIDKYPKYEKYIKKLFLQKEKIILKENDLNNHNTSYTINKGEEIVMCLRSKKNGKIHDINLLTYVMLHELAHVLCPENNHTELFKEIFIFLQDIAVKLNIFTKNNYNISDSEFNEYCGILIS